MWSPAFVRHGHRLPWRKRSRSFVGDALVASRPHERRRCQPEQGDHKGRAGDHKGRPYDAVVSPTGDLSHTRSATSRCRGRTAPDGSARSPRSRSGGRLVRSLGNAEPRPKLSQLGFELARLRLGLVPIRMGLAPVRLGLHGRQQVPAGLRVEELKHGAVGPDPIGRWPFCGDNGHKDSSYTRQRNATVRTICATVRTICVGVGKRLC